MTDLIFKEESYAIQGAVFEVYRQMGHGFLESVYQECLERELKERNIPFVAQSELQLLYKDQPLNQSFKPDLVCCGKIIVELKAAEKIANEHKAQVLNYLKATGFKLGLLVNFGSHPKAQICRLVL
ncbi:MAG: GxxExxY protein [Planctomycetes bacterium]|nr:GxxExxY protein [Planctomycetota bacterium]